MKKILALVLALVMVLGLTAAFADDYHFEIVSKGFQSTYWQAVLKGANEEVDKINGEGADKITINFVGPDSESDVAQQVQQFTSALNANPAAIGFAAVDQNAFNDLLAEAIEKKIPIIGFDSGVPGAPEGAILANAATNNYNAGAMAAEKVYEAVKDRIAAAEGYGVKLEGNEKYVNDAKVESVDDGKIIIETLVPSQVTAELSATDCAALLNKDDIIALYGSNQHSAEAMVTANENLQKLGTGEGQVIGAGFDSGAVIKDAVRNGVFLGAITQAPFAMGEALVDTLVKAANGEAVADVDTGCQWYTAENMDNDEIAINLYD